MTVADQRSTLIISNLECLSLPCVCQPHSIGHEYSCMIAQGSWNNILAHIINDHHPSWSDHGQALIYNVYSNAPVNVHGGGHPHHPCCVTVINPHPCVRCMTYIYIYIYSLCFLTHLGAGAHDVVHWGNVPKWYTASCSPWWTLLFDQFTAYFTMWPGLILCL